MPGRCSSHTDGKRHRFASVWLSRLGASLVGLLALGAQAGQTSATITLTVNLGPSAPVSVVSSPSTVVVCGTASLTGATGCGVINVPTAPGAGGGVPPSVPQTGGSGGNAGSGGAVPVTPTVVPVAPPVVATGPDSTLPSSPLPIARATLELITLLQTQPERGSATALRDLFLLKDSTPARLEEWRARSIQVYTSSAAQRLSNILGTSAEMRIVREVAVDYTEMLVAW